MFTKKRMEKMVSGFVSAVMVMSMLFAVPLTVSAATAVIDADFEDYATVTDTQVANAAGTFQGWTAGNISGGKDVYVSIGEYDPARGKSMKLRAASDGSMRITGLYKNIGSIPSNSLLISYDLYIPTAVQGQRQLTRAFVSYGTSTSAYKQIPSFGMTFKNDATYNTETAENITWVPSIHESKTGTDYPETATAKRLKGDAWYQIDYVYNPTTKKATYYIDGEKVGESSAEIKMESSTEFGNLMFANGTNQTTDVGYTIIDNVTVTELDGVYDNSVYDTIETGTTGINVEWDYTTLTSKYATSEIKVEKFAATDIAMQNGTDITASCSFVNARERGVRVVIGTAAASGEQYRVTMPAMTDIFGNSHSYTFDYAVVGAPVDTTPVTSLVWEDNFDDGNIDGWKSTDEANLKVAYANDPKAESGSDDGALKVYYEGTAARGVKSARYGNLIGEGIVDNTLQYIDFTFDVYLDLQQDTGAPKTMIAFEDYNKGGAMWEGQRFGMWIYNTRLGYLKAALDESGLPKTSAAENIFNSTSGQTDEQWYSYRLRFFPATGVYYLYSVAEDGKETNIANARNGSEATAQKEGVFDLGHVKAAVVKATNNSGEDGAVYYDNFKVTKTTVAKPTEVITSIKFEDVNGNQLSDDIVGAKYIKIYTENVDAIADGTVTLTKGNEEVGYTGVFADGVYTMTLENALTAGTYSLAISDLLAATELVAEGEYKLSNLRFVNSNGQTLSTLPAAGTEIKAAVSVVNTTGKTMKPYIIWAAYDEDSMIYADFKELSIGDVTAISGGAFELPEGTVSIKAFLWSDFDTLTPILPSASLPK